MKLRTNVTKVKKWPQGSNDNACRRGKCSSMAWQTFSVKLSSFGWLLVAIGMEGLEWWDCFESVSPSRQLFWLACVGTRVGGITSNWDSISPLLHENLRFFLWRHLRFLRWRQLSRPLSDVMPLLFCFVGNKFITTGTLDGEVRPLFPNPIVVFWFLLFEDGSCDFCSNEACNWSLQVFEDDMVQN